MDRIKKFKQKCIFYMMIMIMIISCKETKYIEVGTVYTANIKIEEFSEIMTETGSIDGDYCQVYLSNMKNIVEVSFAFLDDGTATGLCPAIISKRNGGKPIMFYTNVALIRYMNSHGWRYIGIDNYIQFKQKFSVFIFEKIYK